MLHVRQVLVAEGWDQRVGNGFSMPPLTRLTVRGSGNFV